VRFQNTFTTTLSDSDGRQTTGLGSYNFFSGKSNLIVDFRNSTFNSARPAANYALQLTNIQNCFYQNFTITASITNSGITTNNSNISNVIFFNVIFNA